MSARAQFLLRQLVGAAFVALAVWLLYWLTRDGVVVFLDALVPLVLATLGAWLISRQWVLDTLKSLGSALRDVLRPLPKDDGGGA